MASPSGSSVRSCRRDEGTERSRRGQPGARYYSPPISAHVVTISPQLLRCRRSRYGERLRAEARTHNSAPRSAQRERGASVVMWKCGRGGGRHRSCEGSRFWCELCGVVQAASAAGKLEALVPRARAAPGAGLDCGARLRAHSGEGWHCGRLPALRYLVISASSPRRTSRSAARIRGTRGRRSCMRFRTPVRRTTAIPMAGRFC